VRHCSQCKNSLYVVPNPHMPKQKMLRCACFKELDIPKFLTTDCLYAMDCERFVPECRQDSYKGQSAYLHDLRACGLSVHNARVGILANEGPQV